jgi:hypothetical protein
LRERATLGTQRERLSTLKGLQPLSQKQAAARLDATLGWRITTPLALPENP